MYNVIPCVTTYNYFTNMYIIHGIYIIHVMYMYVKRAKTQPAQYSFMYNAICYFMTCYPGV